MAEQQNNKDHWDANQYQTSASFVPKLAGKVVQWLDLQKDDVVLDLGCGDGILNKEFAKVLAQGSGSVHGIDSSDAMIQSAKELCKDEKAATFEVVDVSKLDSVPELQKGTFNKVFSNAALHWILRNEETRQSVFDAAGKALSPGGTFALEMGGLGNVTEMRTALLMAVSRRVGFEAAVSADPWFFPDEKWITAALEKAGFRVDKVEREWRPTQADKGGVEGWAKLFGGLVLEAIKDEKEREEALKEAAETLKFTCKNPAGGETINYVRLRALATKL